MGLTDEQRAVIDAAIQAPADEAAPVEPDEAPEPLQGDEAAAWDWLGALYRAAKERRTEALQAWRQVEADIAEATTARQGPPTPDEVARAREAQQAHDDAAAAELAAAEAVKAGVTPEAVEAWRATSTADEPDSAAG